LLVHGPAERRRTSRPWTAEATGWEHRRVTDATRGSAGAAAVSGSSSTLAQAWTTPASVSTLNALAVLCGVLAANALIVGVVERGQVGRAQTHDMINCALGECGMNTSALVQTTVVFAFVIAGVLALAAIVAFVMANHITDRAARDHAEPHSVFESMFQDP